MSHLIVTQLDSYPNSELALTPNNLALTNYA